MIDIDDLLLQDVMLVVDRIEMAIQKYDDGLATTNIFAHRREDIAILCSLIRKVNSMVIEHETRLDK